MNLWTKNLRDIGLLVAIAPVVASGCSQQSPGEASVDSEPAAIAAVDGDLKRLERPAAEVRLTSAPAAPVRLPLPPEYDSSQEPDLIDNPFFPPPISHDENSDEEVVSDENHWAESPSYDYEPADYAPPRELFVEDEAERDAFLEGPIGEVHSEPLTPEQPGAELVAEPSKVFEVEEFDEDAQIAAEASVDDLLAYFPAEDELSEQFKSQVQEVFTLARNGALHAAKSRFEKLLADMARTKDASQMTDRYSRSLAAGLRALEEADDFLDPVAKGHGETASLAAGHQTPMLRVADAKWTLPHEAFAMYHRYAERKLAGAVAGEQAGSMALFGLGKIYQQLAERGDQVPQASRKGLTMYRGATLCHPENHLAANEAGVLLARQGRYEQAKPLLERAAKLANLSTTHQNLAFVHRKLGKGYLAQAHERQAEQLAFQEKARGQLSADRGIAWMSPDQFNRRSGHDSPVPMVGQATVPPVLPANSTPPQTASEQPTMWW